MNTILCAWDKTADLAQQLAKKLSLPITDWGLHRFPDGEIKVTAPTKLAGKTVLLLCSLNQPNEKILAIIFFAEACRANGAKRVVLIAPYLAYMRQDKSFHAGEAVAAKIVAGLISQYFSALITVDPHLHRIKKLSDIYSIPARVVSASAAIINWVKRYRNPVLLGPDEESEQWVSTIAAQAGCDYVTLKKNRRDDDVVEINFPDLTVWQGRDFILIDDIISSGATISDVISELKKQGLNILACIAVHGVFSDNVARRFNDAGVPVITTNAIAHQTNKIDISNELAATIKSFIDEN